MSTTHCNIESVDAFKRVKSITCFEYVERVRETTIGTPFASSVVPTSSKKYMYSTQLQKNTHTSHITLLAIYAASVSILNIVLCLLSFSFCFDTIVNCRI